MLLNLDRAKEIMEKYDLDALVAAAPENVYYLSDFGFSHLFIFAQYGVAAAVLPRDENIPATLIVGEVDIPHLEVNPTWMPEIRMIGSLGAHFSEAVELTDREARIRDSWTRIATRGLRSPNRQVVLAACLKELGLGNSRLAFDDLRVMVELREMGVCDESAVDGVNIFREIRLKKTPAELSLLREAAVMNQTALRQALPLLKDGVTMREVRNAWRVSMVLQGATPVEFYAGGFDRPWPMGSEMYRLRDGDHMQLDGAGTYKHYWADVGRTGVIGGASPRVEEIHGRLLEIYETCVPMLRPGVSSAEIKEAARECASDDLRKGLNTLMHPLGLEVYEMPQPYGEVEREDFTLEVDMVVALECCLYMEFPWGVMQLEDAFIVGDNSVELLGDLPQALLGPDV